MTLPNYLAVIFLFFTRRNSPSGLRDHPTSQPAQSTKKDGFPIRGPWVSYQLNLHTRELDFYEDVPTHRAV